MGRIGRLRPRGPLWRNRDFMWLWAAQSVSQLGSQISGLAIPLVAILVLDASTFEVAVLAVVGWAPFFFFSLPAGAWIDRLRRRPILIAADWGRALALGSIPLAYLLDAMTLTQLSAGRCARHVARTPVRGRRRGDRCVGGCTAPALLALAADQGDRRCRGTRAALQRTVSGQRLGVGSVPAAANPASWPEGEDQGTARVRERARRLRPSSSRAASVMNASSCPGSPPPAVLCWSAS